MQANGQITFDTKNRFVKQKLRLIAKKSQEATKQSAEAAKTPDKQIPSEDHFKFVKDDLKLNQSAITPGKESLQNQKLDELIEKSDAVLLRIQTVWPFEFFTNELTVDPHKVNIIFREDFWSEQIHSVLIRDILDVVVETSIFFATLKIVDQGYTENSINMRYLKKEDALEARKIIQGLVVAHRQGVDFSKVETDSLKDQVTELGKVQHLEE